MYHDRGESKEHLTHTKRGAKTFRRGRAITFLTRMKQKRATIHSQLEKREYQSIEQMLLGELKTIDMVIDEFSQLFELEENEEKQGGRKNNEEN